MMRFRQIPLLASLLLFLALLTSAGCGSDGPLAPEADGPATNVRSAGTATGVVISNPRLIPNNPGPYYMNLWKGIFQDIGSGDPALVAQGVQKLNAQDPDYFNDLLAALVQADGGPGAKVIVVDRVVEVAGNTICTTVEISGEITAKEGTTVTYSNPPLTITHTFNQDSTASLSGSFSYSTSAPSGTSINSDSTTTVGIDAPIDYEGEGGTPSIHGEICGSVTIRVIVETKEG